MANWLFLITILFASNSVLISIILEEFQNVAIYHTRLNLTWPEILAFTGFKLFILAIEMVAWFAFFWPDHDGYMNGGILTSLIIGAIIWITPHLWQKQYLKTHHAYK